MVDKSSLNENADFQIMEELNKFRENPASFVKVFDLTSKFLSRFPKSKKRSTELSVVSTKLADRASVPVLFVSPGLCKAAWQLLNEFNDNNLPLAITPENKFNELLNSNLLSYLGVLQTLDEGNVEQFVPRCFISDFDPQRINSKAFSDKKYRFVGAASKDDKNIILIAEDVMELIVTEKESADDQILNIPELQDQANIESVPQEIPEPQSQEPQNENYLIRDKEDTKIRESNDQKAEDEKPDIVSEPQLVVIEPEILSEPQIEQPQSEVSEEPNQNERDSSLIKSQERDELHESQTKKNLRAHKKVDPKHSENTERVDDLKAFSNTQNNETTNADSQKDVNEKVKSSTNANTDQNYLIKQELQNDPELNSTESKAGSDENDRSKNHTGPVKDDDLKEKNTLRSGRIHHNGNNNDNSNTQNKDSNLYQPNITSNDNQNSDQPKEYLETTTIESSRDDKTQNDNALKQGRKDKGLANSLNELVEDGKLYQLIIDETVECNSTKNASSKSETKEDYSTVLSVGVIVLAVIVSYFVSK